MADNFLFTNNASALLAGSISDIDTVLTVEAGFGALFPNPTGSQKFRAALQDADGNLEIVNVTARSTDTLTIERGQEGTTPLSWTLGVTRVELRLTKGTMEEFLQKNGGTMTGALNMGSNNLVDALINGANTKITGGQIIGLALRGADGDSSNELSVPGDGTRATAGGSAILTQADLASNGGLNLLPISTIVMWYGTPASLPAGWQLCDGTGGTPNLTDRVPIGAGSTYALGAGGGATTASGSTSSSGAHTHTGSAAAHALTEAEIPDHDHGGWTGHNFERGIGAATFNANTFRHAPVIPNYTRNDSLTQDKLASPTNSGVTPDANPLTRGIPGHAGAAAGHTHTVSINSDGAHTHTLSSVSILPPYRAVYFIMKVS